MTLFILGLFVGACIGVFALALVRAGSDNLYHRPDRLRLDTLQKNHWQVGCVDGQFGVLAGSPPKMIGVGLSKNLREAIDGAVAESVISREF